MTGNPADPPHEIRVVQGVATLLRFQSPLNREAIEVDGRGTRITVDAGDRSLFLEPLLELGSTERLALRVSFADGKAPAEAMFVLVPASSEVDTRIDVIRLEPSEATCQTELLALKALCRAMGPLEFARAGYLDETGVKTTSFEFYRDEAGGFEAERGVSHLGPGWLLLDVRIINGSSQPWAPQGATLTSKAGRQVTVRAMTAIPEAIPSGQKGRILVEAEAPPKGAGGEYVLELGGKDGRSFSIPAVRVPTKVEGKP
ncbi:hypothetical protein DB31_2529 [Hyalangium minutum]|uniref:DUF2381 family protein n=1 Tax=Hyalangium minutum TaxID=394096 RepID=A0A085W6U8_9BACT|nr:hypothetical protein DB31_2529 [Hyalangium minutum]